MPLLNDLHWLCERITYNSVFWCTTVFMSWCHTVYTRCHSSYCWSNVAPSTAVCVVIRSCGASNTSFITWRQSLCGCWTMCIYLIDCASPLAFKKYLKTFLCCLFFWSM